MNVGSAGARPPRTQRLPMARQRALRAAAEAPADRVYWIGLQDLHPAREAIEGDHVDEHEYHLGLLTAEGEPKPACDVFRGLLNRQPACGRG